MNKYDLKGGNYYVGDRNWVFYMSDDYFEDNVPTPLISIRHLEIGYEKYISYHNKSGCSTLSSSFNDYELANKEDAAFLKLCMIKKEKITEEEWNNWLNGDRGIIEEINNKLDEISNFCNLLLKNNIYLKNEQDK